MSEEKIIIANWKMKLSLQDSLKLAEEIKKVFKNFEKGEVAVCPNMLSLVGVGEILKGTNVKVGAQNVFWEEKGAFTGEVSASMLKEAGCK